MTHVVADREAYLLRVLAKRRYLDGPSLRALFYFDRKERTCWNSLRQLVDLGWVDRTNRYVPPIPRGGSRRPPSVYWITVSGAELVKTNFGEERVSVPRGRARGETYDPYIEHTLAINAFWVALVKAWRNSDVLATVEWRDEFAGAKLKVPLLSVDPKTGRRKTLDFRPDAYVDLRLLRAGGQLTVPTIEYEQMLGAPRWETVSRWDTLFPEFAKRSFKGKIVHRAAFVEMDMGKASTEQLRKKLERYKFVQERKEHWVKHYNVPMVRPGTPMWPGMLVIALTERRMRTLGQVFGADKGGYAGWVYAGCMAWDKKGDDGKPLGLVEGPCWWDVQGGGERLTLAEVFLGKGKQGRP